LLFAPMGVCQTQSQTRRDAKGVFTYGRYEHDEKSCEHWYAIADSVGERSDNGVNH